MSDLHLSPRQIEVCIHTAAGESDGWIARELKISARTVQQHMADAALRIRRACPWIRPGSPRKVILRYYVEYAGTAAFDQRRKEAA